MQHANSIEQINFARLHRPTIERDKEENAFWNENIWKYSYLILLSNW